jgi:outer membrane protein TolC
LFIHRLARFPDSVLPLALFCSLLFLISLISSSYYDLIRQNLRVNNFKKGLEISNDRLKLAKDRYEVGQGSKVDYYSAQVDYNEDKALLIAQEQSYLNTKISYNTLLVRNHQEEFN